MSDHPPPPLPEGHTPSHGHTDPCGQMRRCTSSEPLILVSAQHVASETFSMEGLSSQVEATEWSLRLLTVFSGRV